VGSSFETLSTKSPTSLELAFITPPHLGCTQFYLGSQFKWKNFGC
jgi:hypothetical protein